MRSLSSDVKEVRKRLKQIKRIHVQSTKISAPEIKKYAGPNSKIAKAAFESKKMAERAEYLMGGLKRDVFDDAVCRGCDGNCPVQLTSFMNRPGGRRLIPCIIDAFTKLEPWVEYTMEYVSTRMFNVHGDFCVLLGSLRVCLELSFLYSTA